MIQTMIHKSFLEVAQGRFGVFQTAFFEMLMAVSEQRRAVSAGDGSLEEVLEASL